MITKRQFKTFEDLFNYYNAELFDGELPEVMINMSRKKNSHGFFAPERWKEHVAIDETDKCGTVPKNANISDRIIHEISLNPDSLQRPPINWHSTLVHEMVHLWERVKGLQSRRAYHNAHWAKKMESIGLMPSHNGQPGGRKTGQNMTHYVIPSGPFETSFKLIWDGDFNDMVLPYIPNHLDIVTTTKSGAESRSGKKVKYTCSCGQNIWGKPDLKVICFKCNENFEPA